MLGKRPTRFLQGLLFIDCFPTMKGLSTIWAMLCMLCEAVRRSGGSTVYTWERPNNNSRGASLLGEDSAVHLHLWEKRQWRYKCLRIWQTGLETTMTWMAEPTRPHSPQEELCHSDVHSHNSDWLAYSVSISSLFQYQHGAHQGNSDDRILEI